MCGVLLMLKVMGWWGLCRNMVVCGCCFICCGLMVMLLCVGVW